jgi:hypothetical protein
MKFFNSKFQGYCFEQFGTVHKEDTCNTDGMRVDKLTRNHALCPEEIRKR